MARIYTSGGDIRRCRFVRLSGNNTVVECNQGERPHGISQYGSREAPLPSVVTDPPLAAKSGDILEIHSLNTDETIILEAGLGGWTAGDTLVSDADGKGIVGAGAVGAIAVESTAAGELGPVMLVCLDRPNPAPALVLEFDCETGQGGDTPKTIIPAAINTTGLLITGVYGLVSEVFAGSSQDQGIVTVRDSDANAITTLTPSDAGADVVDDVIAGYSLPGQSTGAAAKIVPAGKGVEALVTQATSGGTPAGKMKVVVIAMPL
jgi:hypothetical protein